MYDHLSMKSNECKDQVLLVSCFKNRIWERMNVTYLLMTHGMLNIAFMYTVIQLLVMMTYFIFFSNKLVCSDKVYFMIEASSKQNKNKMPKGQIDLNSRSLQSTSFISILLPVP